MNFKTITTWILRLFRLHENDQEILSQHIQVLHRRIDIQREIIDCLVEINRDRFTGHEDTLRKLRHIIRRDKSGSRIRRRLDASQFQRDQILAMIEEAQRLAADLDTAGG